MKKKLLALYLKEFNRDYLSTREDRRRVLAELVKFMGFLAMWAVTVIILRVME
ncbi:MAG: hypothetical protein WCR92_06390 [Candidatus Cloacimonadaceae bacterium]|jgi:hypothetical protein